MHVFYCKKCKKDSLTPICEHCGQPITALSSNERFKWRAIRVPLGDARSIWGALKVLALAEQVVRLPGAYYHYLQREGSAMNNKNCARNVEILYAFDDILGWFGEHGLREAYRDELTFLAISHLLIAASVRVARIDCKSELLGQFRDYMEKNFPDFRENRYLPRLDRNKRLVYRLLLKRRYRVVRLLFRVKDALGR